MSILNCHACVCAWVIILCCSTRKCLKKDSAQNAHSIQSNWTNWTGSNVLGHGTRCPVWMHPGSLYQDLNGTVMKTAVVAVQRGIWHEDALNPCCSAYDWTLSARSSQKMAWNSSSAIHHLYMHMCELYVRNKQDIDPHRSKIMVKIHETQLPNGIIANLHMDRYKYLKSNFLKQ